MRLHVAVVDWRARQARTGRLTEPEKQGAAKIIMIMIITIITLLPPPPPPKSGHLLVSDKNKADWARALPNANATTTTTTANVKPPLPNSPVFVFCNLFQ